jgi:hypothetical protein
MYLCVIYVQFFVCLMIASGCGRVTAVFCDLLTLACGRNEHRVENKDERKIRNSSSQPVAAKRVPKRGNRGVPRVIGGVGEPPKEGALFGLWSSSQGHLGQYNCYASDFVNFAR